jgi:hypothetical protein
MSTATDEDLTVIESLDFDFDIHCEWMGHDCEVPAEWRIVLSCCGRTTFFCDEHFKIQIKRFGKYKIIEDQDPPIGCGKETSIMFTERIRIGT